jgi:hypothetical protein
MEIVNSSIRNFLYGLIVFFLNIPVFWSFAAFINFIKDVLAILGMGV